MHAVTHTKRAWQAERDLTRLWQESESIHRHHSRSVHCVGTHLAMNSSLLQRRLSLLTDQERSGVGQKKDGRKVEMTEEGRSIQKMDEMQVMTDELWLSGRDRQKHSICPPLHCDNKSLLSKSTNIMRNEVLKTVKKM